MKQSNLVNIIGGLLHSRGRYFKQTTHPVRDWFIGLFTALLLIVVGGSQSIYFFTKYQDVYRSGNQETEQTSTYNRGQAQTALKLYSEKETFYNQKRNINFAPAIVLVLDQATSSNAVIPTASSTIDSEAGEDVEIQTATTTEL